MDAITAASVGDLATLIPSFERSLRAANKSPKTVQVYGEAANQLPGPSRGNLRCPLARWAPAARHRGHPLGIAGIRSLIERRAKQTGIGHVHAHLFRHSFAHRWLADGGNETDLMRLVGWRTREMLSRYGASAADERARAG